MKFTSLDKAYAGPSIERERAAAERRELPRASADPFEVRCFLVLYPGGSRAWPAAQEKLARFYAKAQGGIVIEMAPKFPDAVEQVQQRFQAFAPTLPLQLE